MTINCHCHIFSLECVPLGFRERFLLNAKNPRHRLLHRVVRRLLPRQWRVSEWLELARKSIAELADALVAEMDEAGVDLCTPLMMDMAFCTAFGGETMPFEQQLAETEAAARAVNQRCGRSRMMPFVAADPRRENVEELVLEALARGVFKGVKIYPPMGYTPDDPRLRPIFDYCVRNAVPVTTHCENGGIPGLGKACRLAHPKHWAAVLEDFPALTLNLAHNDRTGSRWQPPIADLIRRYPNVYTDVSYDVEMWYKPRRYFRSIQRMLQDEALGRRLLWGTDWYMGRALWTEASYLRWFTDYARRIFWCRVAFTQAEIKRLTEDNPKQFLGLDDDTPA